MQKDKKQKLFYAKKSLHGLWMGDCFGETFFVTLDIAKTRIQERILGKAPWHFTDDTIMGIGLYKVLEDYGYVHQEALASTFAKNYIKAPSRGYGGTAHSILSAIYSGRRWQEVSSAAFDGMGSMGNGAAMRAGVVGAYYFEDMDKTIEEAIRSAEVTHYNQEGIAGAVAVAVAANLSINCNLHNNSMEAAQLITHVANRTPESDTKYKIKTAATIPKEAGIDFLVSVLGNGSRIIAQDTVPISIWFAAHNRLYFEEALWKAVSVLGDRDTICAIVGSIVVLSDDHIPTLWIRNAEPLESSVFWKG